MESKDGGSDNKWTPPFCTIVAVNMTSFCYRSCSLCERTLPDDPSSLCPSCSSNSASNPGSKRLFRIPVSIATGDKVFVVICFDRAARVLFGCSADEFFHFCNRRHLVAEKAVELLEGEMCQMTLSKPKNGAAQHLRAVSVVPLRTGFRPVIHTLKQIYGIGKCANAGISSESNQETIESQSKDPTMENKDDNINKWTPPFCTVVAVDMTNFCYRSCAVCERTLPDDPSSFCSYCSSNCTANPGAKRLFRIIVSVATVDKVMVIICFDRTARVLFGCSADDFFHFCNLHPFAAERAAELLQGEMCQMTLSRPKNGNAQHLRAVSIVPLRTGFCPVIDTLKQIYAAGASSNNRTREN